MILYMTIPIHGPCLLIVWESLTFILPFIKLSMKSAPQNRFGNRKKAVYFALLLIALLFESLPFTTTRDVTESKPIYFAFILFVPDKRSTDGKFLDVLLSVDTGLSKSNSPPAPHKGLALVSKLKFSYSKNNLVR